MVLVDYFKGSMKPSQKAVETGKFQWADRDADILLL